MAEEIEGSGSGIGFRSSTDPTTEIITLTTTLEDIPDGPKCLVCAAPTVKAYVTHHLGLKNRTLFVAPHAAGYRCITDDMDYLSPAAVMETLEKARQRLFSRDDSASVAEVDRSILFQQGRSVNE